MDYNQIGLKAGLEIHQQLNTKKLFCECPSLLRKDGPLFLVKKELNPVSGESGKIDVAVLYEKSRAREFIYEVYDTNCLVELDEEPPHKINEEALNISIQIALLLNCKIFPVTQIMRKIVIDGSNTSGFQRTVLIAYGGFVETSQGIVGIETIALEEDAARIISQDEKNTIYRLDRLGIPLVEIVTKPELYTPEQIKECALKIGEIIRSCNVKRGIGTIRQDLNISIKGSKRVEIKGFQDPKIMVQTVCEEIKRQQECIINKRCINEVRRSNPDASTTFLRPMPGSARMYPETDLSLLKISKEIVNNAKNNLPKLRQELIGYLKDFGLNDELIKLILKENKLDDFKSLLYVYNNPSLVAKALVLFPKEIASKENKSIKEVEEILNYDKIESILSEVDKKISKENVKVVMQDIINGKSFEESLEKEEFDIDEEIIKLIKEKPSLSINAYMGLLIKKLGGKISGKVIMEKLREVL